MSSHMMRSSVIGCEEAAMRKISNKRAQQHCRLDGVIPKSQGAHAPENCILFTLFGLILGSYVVALASWTQVGSVSCRQHKVQFCIFCPFASVCARGGRSTCPTSTNTEYVEHITWIREAVAKCFWIVGVPQPCATLMLMWVAAAWTVSEEGDGRAGASRVGHVFSLYPLTPKQRWSQFCSLDK